MSVKFVVDSSSDISAAEAERLGITMLPMSVRFGDEEYLDGVTLEPTAFFEKLIESDVMPKTSQVTPVQFEDCFRALTADGSEVVAITVSSKLSGTYFSAVTAAQEFEGRVFAVDSLSVSSGERGLLEYGMRLREEGRSAAEIAQALNDVRGRIRLIALLDTLEYLKRGGRISAAAAAIGSTLKLKPVAAIVNGEVKMIGKALGSRKGNNLLIQTIREGEGIDFSMPHCAIYSGLSDAMLRKYIVDAADLWQEHMEEVPIRIIGATVGTHIGPGAVGIVYFANKPAE